MPACGACVGMTKAQFGIHAQELAEELRSKVAEKAAKTVMTNATHVQNRAQYKANMAAYKKAKANGTDVSYPVPVGPDHGYHYLAGFDKELVNQYQNDYQVNLLTFKATDEESARQRLEDEELDWIIEKFERVKNFPDHNKIKPVLDMFVRLAGDGQMVDVEFDQSQKGSAVETSNSGPTGQGKFGAAEFTLAGGMSSAVEGFDSATGKSFRDQFVPRIPIAANNQKGAVRAIRNLLANNEGVYRWARKDIDSLLHDGITAVEHFEDCKSRDDDMGATLGLVGGIGSVIGGIIGFPLSSGLSVAAIAGGLRLVSGAMSSSRLFYLEGQKQEKKRLSGETVDEVLEKIIEFADQTYAKLDEFNGALAENGFGGVDTHMFNEKQLFAAPTPLKEFMSSKTDNVRKRVESDTE